MMHEKRRIIVELSEEDYKILLSLKNFVDLSWKDFLIAGALYIADELKLEEKIDSLINTVEMLKKAKLDLN